METVLSLLDKVEILKTLCKESDRISKDLVYGKYTSKTMDFYVMGYSNHGREVFKGICVNLIPAEWPAMPLADWLLENGTIEIFDSPVVLSELLKSKSAS